MPRRLNLDAHQPDDIVLTFKGAEYEMPGTIPVPTIVRMMRFLERVEGAKGKTDKEAASAYAGILQDVIESGDSGAPGIMDLIRERDPDVATLPFSVQDLLTIIQFLIEALDVEEAMRAAGDVPDEEPAVPLAQAS